MTEKFIRGNDRLAKMLADPTTRAEVDAIVDEMDQVDRAYKMGLAAVRHAANLTQSELAQRMGIKQSALSGVENREDLLLSTLASYLEAAGAHDIRICAKLGDNEIEMPLQSTAVPPTPEPRTYTVVSGDTLWAIAERFYGDGNKYQQIADASGLADQEEVRPGQALTIP